MSTLRAFLELTSRVADFCFRPPDQMLAHFLAEMPDGKRSLIAGTMADGSEEVMPAGVFSPRRGRPNALPASRRRCRPAARTTWRW